MGVSGVSNGVGPLGHTSRRWRVAVRVGIVIFAITVLVWGHGVLLAAWGRWLIEPDPLPNRVDVLIAISGDPSGIREAEATRLWRQGIGEKIVLSGGPVGWNTTSADIMRRHVLELGVPDSVLVTERESTSTAENASFTLPLVKSLGAGSVVVVTSDYHVRRTRLAFRRVYADSGIRVYVHGADDPGFDPARWWKSSHGLEYGLSETAKLLWYWGR